VTFARFSGAADCDANPSLNTDVPWAALRAGPRAAG